MKNKDIKELKGYVEAHDSVVHWTIYFRPNGDFTVWQDSDLNDYSEDFEDYLEACDGKIYNSLKDYKKDKYIDIREFIKSIGWEQIKDNK